MVFKKVIIEEFRVPATNDSLKLLRNFVAKTGKKHRFSDKVINAFKLAVDEASTNIIRHSYRDRRGDITIRAIIKKDSFTVSLIDQGRYFDPTNVKNPDLKRYVAIGKKGGLGIFMIRKLVDDIAYHRTEEGNELRLTKNKNIERKRRFALPSVPGSMRTKYYAVSSAIISTIVLVAYVYNYAITENKILDTSFTQMESFSALLSSNAANWINENYSQVKMSREAMMVLAEYDSLGLVVFAAITDLNRKVLASTKHEAISLFDTFSPGDTVRTYRNNILRVSKVVKDSNNETTDYFVVRSAVSPRGFGVVGNAHLYFPAGPTFELLSQKRTSNLKFALIGLLLANVGVGLLIFLIFTPLQKLSNWVGDMGKEDIRDKIDIDTSNEVGKIAHAFGEITDKFRESQRSLVDQERIQQEMHLAKEIQQTLLPSEFPDIKGYEIASHYESAKEVGGDYYDFVEVDQDRTGVVVADVSGKGVPGSLVMTMIRTALRSEAKGTGSAAEVLTRVNNFVIDDIKKGMFVTLFYAILDARRRRITFASAGHNPMILYRSGTKKSYYLNPKGFPVGISVGESDLFQKSIEDDTIQLTRGDIIICYTDGITEAMNAKRELFGEERFHEVICRFGHLNAKEFVEKLKEELDSFTEGQVQYDDITFVVIKEKMTPEESEFERANGIHYEILNGKSKTEACLKHGMPISTFSQKYQEKLEQLGAEEFKKGFEKTSVEGNHLSVEEQTKIYDIMRQYPELGAKRISDLLNTKEYGYAVIPAKRIYDELVRKRLNTKSLRTGYVNRGVNKKRMKPPGTPMLTLDGQIIMDEHLGPKLLAPIEPVIQKPEPPVVEVKKRPKPGKKSIEEKEGAELILADIVDLLDKGEVKRDKEKSPEDIEKYDSGIKELLEGKSDQDTTGEGKKVKEEIEFSDLSATEYTENLFDDKTNGGDKEKTEDTETDEQVASGKKSKKSKKSPEQVLNDLSVSVDEDDYSESELESFEELISDGVELKSEKDEKKRPIPEDGELTTERPEEMAETQNSLEIQSERQTSKNVEDVFNELSVNIKDDEQVMVYDSPITADKKVEEFYDLVSGEEISFQEELIKTENSGKKSSEVIKKGKKDSKKPKPDNQQKLLIAGGHFYMQKKYDKAIDVFSRIIDKYPNNIEAHYNLGNSYFRIKKYDEAQIAFEKVCDLDPSFLDTMENRGVFFANKKEFKKAIKIWKKILEFDPKREDIRKNIEKAFRISRKK